MKVNIASLGLAHPFEVGYDNAENLLNQTTNTLISLGASCRNVGVVLHDLETVREAAAGLKNLEADVLLICIATWSEDHHLLDLLSYNTVSVTTEVVEGGEARAVKKSLQDVIKVALVEGHIELSQGNMEESARAAEVLSAVESYGVNMQEPQEGQTEATKWASVGDFQYEGRINTELADDTEANTKNIAVVIYWKPSGEDGTYSDSDFNSAVNTTSDGSPLYLNLGLQFRATQAGVEMGEDSEEADGEEDV